MTRIAGTKAALILALGDIVAYAFSLILALAIRYGGIPGSGLLAAHLPAFAILFAIFLIVNFSAGMYDAQNLIRGRGQTSIIRVQIINLIIGVIFFYLGPTNIAPKTNLFIYAVISTICLIIWREVMFPVVTVSRKRLAILVGNGPDISDLKEEVNANPRYGLSFIENISPGSSAADTAGLITDAVSNTGASIVAVDLHNRAVEAAMPSLYSLIFSGLQVIDAGKLYETIFGRIPISMLGERWLVENSGTALGSRRLYDSLKRATDVVLGLVGGIISLIFYPFVYIAIKLEDHGPVFIKQDRIGKKGRNITIVKFRSMSGNDDGKYGKQGTTANVITKVGAFLRRSRLDELPQLWNVIKGDLSLVGPRPELPQLVGIYEKNIPYYNVRHLVKPGLSGWAQIYHENHPHHGVDTEESRNKLSYDLYYIKNRSLALDMRIMLRTFQIILSRKGR